MNTLKIENLEMNQALDQQALQRVSGGLIREFLDGIAKAQKILGCLLFGGGHGSGCGKFNLGPNS
jgi:hypothetical protein